MPVPGIKRTKGKKLGGLHGVVHHGSQLGLLAPSARSQITVRSLESLITAINTLKYEYVLFIKNIIICVILPQNTAQYQH